MNTLRISLFASVAIAHPGRPSGFRITRTIQELLAYLVLNRNRSHSRETLAGLFWGEHDEERARHCLSTALWRLRRILEPEGIPEGTYLTTTDSGEVRFNRDSDHWLDVAVFEERIGRALAQPIHTIGEVDVAALESALLLHTGELLEGFYDDWVLRERERLRHLHLSSLAYLMRYYGEHQAYEQSIACGRKILHHDPLREEIHRELMKLYLASGQRALAARQFESCAETLIKELGIAPMEETRQLYGQIAPEVSPSARYIGESELAANRADVLRQLRRALQSVEAAGDKVRRAIRMIEKPPDKLERGLADRE